MVVARRCLGEVASAESGEFWSYAKYDYEAYVTTLSQEEAQSWQVVALYRERGDCENVFDELKNQWGFNGFCSRSRNVNESAVRLLLVAYNLWNLFLRLLEPSRHVEDRHGRTALVSVSFRQAGAGRPPADLENRRQRRVVGNPQRRLHAGFSLACHNCAAVGIHPTKRPSKRRRNRQNLNFNCGI